MGLFDFLMKGNTNDTNDENERQEAIDREAERQATGFLSTADRDHPKWFV